MPGDRNGAQWEWPKAGRPLENLTAETSCGRWQLNFGSRSARTKRPALLTRWVGLRWEECWAPLFLELTDPPEYRKGGSWANDKPPA